MHILLIPSWYPKTPSDINGVFFRDQALALNNYGHKVGVIAPIMVSMSSLSKSGALQKPPAFENDNGVLTYRKQLLAYLPLLPYGNYWLFKQAARKLLNRYIADNGIPDILHAHASIFGGAVGAELSGEFGIPMILTEHSTRFALHTYANWQLKLAQQAIKGARLCIAVSPSLAGLMSAKYSGGAVNWKWVPNVVAERFNDVRHVQSKNDSIRFLNLALMTEKKGQFDLLMAFGAVSREYVNAELWLAGGGPIRAKLERLAKTIGVAEKVKFLGLIEPDKVPDLLAQVDVMVVSSHYETFGVVVAEALMAGVPVVATRSGGPECIVEARDGLLVDPCQPEELGKAMIQLARNLAAYNSQEIAASAKARFAGPAVASRLTLEYESVLLSKLFK